MGTRTSGTAQRRTQNAPLERAVATPECFKASARPCFRSKIASHMEDNSWLGNRHRGRTACGNRRGQPARIVSGAALFLTEGEQTAQTCANTWLHQQHANRYNCVS